MSRVVIQGDASGTGDFTIAAPNSNTDRTLTLPDEAGEVLVNGTTSNVGIGTSSPTMKLDISGTNYGGVNIKSTSTNYSGILLENTNSATKWQIGVEGGAYNTAGKLNIGIDAVGPAIIIDSSRRITMPNQPAFNATRTAGNVTNAVAIWNSVSTNVGGHYNATSGLFTAPVAGSYFFIANAICGSSGTSANSGTLQLRVNGSSIKDAHWNMSDPWENVTLPAVVTLNANDFVDVYVSGNFMYGGGIYSQFNGYLIG